MYNKEIVVSGGDIYTPQNVISDGYIHIKEGKINEIGNSSEEIPPNSKVIDAENKMVFPGLIDIHVNGGGGSLSVDGTVDAIRNIAKAHAQFGTTSIVPTTISVDNETLEKTIESVALISKKQIKGANVLGIHLEGPFLNPEKGGAHQKKFIQKPSIDLFDKFLKLSEGKLRILSLAPEIEGSLELIKHAHDQGVLVALAHSKATYDQTLEAFNHGLTLCAHLFNGMPPLSHRSPGPAGVFLTEKNTYFELISDGMHVHPTVMEIAIKAKGKDGVILVTDAVNPAGTSIKSFEILGTKLEVKDNSCYLPNGGLAGSALTMNEAVKVVARNTSTTLNEAIKMASLNPACLLGIDREKGSLEEGKDADILIVDDDINVLTTIVEGRIVHQK